MNILGETRHPLTGRSQRSGKLDMFREGDVIDTRIVHAKVEFSNVWYIETKRTPC